MLILSKDYSSEVMRKYAESLTRLSSMFESKEIIRSNFAWLIEPEEKNHDQSEGDIMFHSNVYSKGFPIIPFPFEVKRICSPTFLHCFLGESVLFEFDFYNHLPIDLSNCSIHATFRKLVKDLPLPVPTNIAFRKNCSSQTVEQTHSQSACYSLDCISSALQSQMKERKCNNNGMLASKEREVEEFNAVVSTPFKMKSGLNKCHIQIKSDRNIGCFWLCSLQIRCGEIPNCTFTLDYLYEMYRNKLLEHVLCFVDALEPSISIYFCNDFEEKLRNKMGTKKQEFPFPVTDDHEPLKLVAGMRQKFDFELNAGTIPIRESTRLIVSFVGISHRKLKFRNTTDGEWTAEGIDYSIPPIESNGAHHGQIILYMELDQILPLEDESSDEQNNNYEIQFDWRLSSEQDSNQDCHNYHLIAQKFVQIQFLPIMMLRSGISLLAGNVIYILDIQRTQRTQNGIEEFEVVPIDVSLHQERNIAQEPTEAELLNPKPLRAIVDNSCSRFVWKLPESSAGKAVAVPHYLRFTYQVRRKTKADANEQQQQQSEDEEDNERRPEDYLVERRLDFPIPKVEYEICTRFYYEQSQSLLCRIEEQCDFVVSLRSLTKSIEAQTVVVCIEADPKQWLCPERYKMTKISYSGVGQAIFTIVPKMLGYIPYPSLSIRKYNLSEASPSKNPSVNEKYLGESVLSYYRNRGSQIHILGPLNKSDETASMGASSTNTNTTETSEHKKKSLKTQAKDRLHKLFE